MWQVIEVNSKDREISFIEVDNSKVLKGGERVTKHQTIKQMYTGLPEPDLSVEYWNSCGGPSGCGTRGLTIGYKEAFWDRICKEAKIGQIVKARGRPITKSEKVIIEKDDSGVKTKTWVASGPKPCSACEDLDGQSVDLGSKFSNDLYGPPLHPNCQCSLEVEKSDVLTEDTPAAAAIREIAKKLYDKKIGQSEKDAWDVAMATAIHTPEGRVLYEKYKKEKLVRKEVDQMTKEEAITGLWGLARKEVSKSSVHTPEQAFASAAMSSSEGRELYMQTKQKMPDLSQHWAVTKLEEIAKSFVQKDGKLDYSHAFIKACESNPDLYLQYRQASRQSV